MAIRVHERESLGLYASHPSLSAILIMDATLTQRGLVKSLGLQIQVSPQSGQVTLTLVSFLTGKMEVGRLPSQHTEKN